MKKPLRGGGTLIVIIAAQTFMRPTCSGGSP